MKILVTGSSGRIARAIYVRLLLEHEVVGFDRSPSSTADVVGDLNDAQALRRALQGVDAIVHTAGLHAPHVGVVSDAEFDRVNVQGTALLVQLAAEAGVPRLVYTSTTAVYGLAATPIGAAGWVDDDLVPQPRTIYHRSKLAAEALLSAAAAAGGLAVTVMRMSRCFPEPAPIMAAYRLHRGIDARDVAEAHALALQASHTGYRCFIVSGASPFLPEDTAALLERAPSVLERRAPDLVAAFERRGWPLPQSIDRVYSPRRAMSELAWQPRYGFDEVLKKLDERSSDVLPPRRPTGEKPHA